MARIDTRISTRFEQESDTSNTKFVLATLPLAAVIVWFLIEAYQRPFKPFYNLPSYITDDRIIQSAADDSGSFVPLMDMCYVVLSFCVLWACLTGYFLGFLRARHAMIERYLQEGTSVLGNVVYEGRCWAFEFRYYGYCSYTHPSARHAAGQTNNDGHIRKGLPIIRKKTRIFEPYTRELVPILCLPGYPKSGQGKDDLEYASLIASKNRSREVFLGRFCLLWAIICALVPVYILCQMRIIDEAEYYAGIKDDYENADKGWIIYCVLMGVGVLGVAMGGNALVWLYRRWWLLHQGHFAEDDLSTHGDDYNAVGAASSDSQYCENYQRM